jgi:hypothetical protein
MDAEAARIRALVAEACDLIEQAGRPETFPADVAAALQLVRMDLFAAAFDTCDIEATDDACGAVQTIDETLVSLADRREHAIARAG